MNLFRARIKKLMSALGFPCCWVPKKYSAGKKKKKSSNCWLKENSAPPFTCYSFTHIAGRVRITLVYRHRLVKMKAKVELPSRRWKGNSRGKHEVPEQQQHSDQLWSHVTIPSFQISPNAREGRDWNPNWTPRLKPGTALNQPRSPTKDARTRSTSCRSTQSTRGSTARGDARPPAWQLFINLRVWQDSHAKYFTL